MTEQKHFTYFETDPLELSERAILPDPEIVFDEGTSDKGWHLFHSVGYISIVDERDCSFERTVEMLTDLAIRHTMHKLGINDYNELNFMLRKYTIAFVFTEVEQP